MTWLDIDKFRVADSKFINIHYRDKRFKWVQVRGTWVTMIRAKPKYISVNKWRQSDKMYTCIGK